MRIVIFIWLSIIASVGNAIGWQELSVESARNIGANVEISLLPKRNCYSVKANFPQQVPFESLGEFHLVGIRFLKVDYKEKGWQLTQKGTQIDLLVQSKPKNMVYTELCLSEEDLRNGILSANYLGQQGSPPMVVIIKLIEFSLQ